MASKAEMKAKEQNISKYAYTPGTDADACNDWEKALARQMRQAHLLRDAYEGESTLDTIISHLEDEMATLTKKRFKLRSEQGWRTVLLLGNRRIAVSYYSQLDYEISVATEHENIIRIPNSNIRGYSESRGSFTLKARI